MSEAGNDCGVAQEPNRRMCSERSGTHVRTILTTSRSSGLISFSFVSAMVSIRASLDPHFDRTA
jgi:hypothetical protein